MMVFVCVSSHSPKMHILQFDAVSTQIEINRCKQSVFRQRPLQGHLDLQQNAEPRQSMIHFRSLMKQVNDSFTDQNPPSNIY
jgi:hypothetical protein